MENLDLEPKGDNSGPICCAWILKTNGKLGYLNLGEYCIGNVEAFIKIFLYFLTKAKESELFTKTATTKSKPARLRFILRDNLIQSLK